MSLAENSSAALGKTLTYSATKAIQALKSEISPTDYLEHIGVEVRHGRACCPIRRGDNPEVFSIRDERWHCFRCDRGGDVVDLAQAVEGRELWECVVSLAQTFNVDLPRRPERWHDWQDDKARVRRAAQRHLASVYQRRLTRVYAPLVLVGGETPEEEFQELQELATSLWPVSNDLAKRRLAGE